MKKTMALILATLGFAAYAEIAGDYNTWLGYLAGDSATGNRVTVQGAGAGGGASDLLRTDLFGAAAGVYATYLIDSVGIGYRAFRQSSSMSNCVAIGSHALEGITMSGGINDATWINGHIVVNPPVYIPDNASWDQARGTFYITPDATLTNSLAPIWYDGENLHLRGFSPGSGGGGGISTASDLLALMASAGMDYVDSTGAVWTAEYRIKFCNENSQLDPEQQDEILYFDEATFGGLRAWTNATSSIVFMLSNGTVYYVTDRSQADESNPLANAQEGGFVGTNFLGVEMNLWSPNVTTFEYVRYRAKDTVVYMSKLRETLVGMGVSVGGQ